MEQMNIRTKRAAVLAASAAVLAAGLGLMLFGELRSGDDDLGDTGPPVTSTTADSTIESAPPATSIPTAPTEAATSPIENSDVPLDVSATLIYAQSDEIIPGGAELNDEFGGVLSVVDLNGDSIAELLVGSTGEAVGESTSAGIVHLLSGGAPEGSEALRLSQQNAEIAGSAEPGDEFGFAMAGGDFNGDGFNDLAIGVPGEAIGDRGNAGLVHVLSGGADGIDFDEDVVFTQGELPGVTEADDRFGASLAAADFNGDGLTDLAVGVPNESVGELAGAGYVNVLFGTSSGLETASSVGFSQDDIGSETLAEEFFGQALVAGDFNGDGLSDLAVASPGENGGAGVVHVLTGSTGQFVSDAIVFVLAQGEPGLPGSAEAGDQFGAEMVAADFDGDGLDDLAIGAPGEALGDEIDAGLVLVLTGGQLGFESTLALHQGVLPGSTEGGDRFGEAMAGADLDDDGFADLAIGSPGESLADLSAAGSVFVLNGSATGLVIENAATAVTQTALPGSPEAGDRFGAELAAGDVTGDGIPDLIVGSPGEFIGDVENAGLVHVIPGRR